MQERENPMKNIEIEIRIRLSREQVFLDWLNKHAKHLVSVNQVDYYFDNPSKSFIYTDPDGFKDADEWLRLRHDITKRISIVGYKKWIREEITRKSLYAEEFETSIEDINQAREIFNRLGFVEIARVIKHREKWQYGDFIFDCDQVEDLGYFVEIEYVGQIDNPTQGNQKIYNLLAEIGVENWEENWRGYPWELWNRK